MDKLYNMQEQELTAAHKMINQYRKENKYLWFYAILMTFIVAGLFIWVVSH